MSIRKSCLAAFLAALTVLAALPLHASPLPLTARQLAAGSPHVVVAVVEDVQSRWNESHTLIVTDHELRIEDRLKGDAPERVTLTVPGGTVDGETHGTSLSTLLDTGSRYLLFLGDLDRPTFTPVTGGWQGVFPESAGGFGKTLRSARELIAAVAAHPEPADTAWLVRRENPELPAKAWDPRGAKFIVREPAAAPIVVDPLPPGRFYREDQKQMAYWNVYARNLFRVSPHPSPTWAFGNGVFDVAGFVTSAQLQQQFGLDWLPGGTSLTWWRVQDGHIVEADIAFNPAFEWTLDDEAATRPGGPISFKDTLLSSFGHAWGYHGLLDLTGGINLTPISRDSALNLKAPPFDLATLMAEDTRAVRSIYPGTSIRDGVISAYSTSPSPLTPFYTPVLVSVPSARAGTRINLINPVKIENAGTQDFANPSVDVYLVPKRFSLDRAILLKRFQLQDTVRPGEAKTLALGEVLLPASVRAGSYYFAFVLGLQGDRYPANNRAWSNHDVKITVTR
jgi:hypothetical protein